jgi:ligand-binding sensor domain-containing protein
MKKILNKKSVQYSVIAILLLGLISLGVMWIRNSSAGPESPDTFGDLSDVSAQGSAHALHGKAELMKDAGSLPVYGNWQNFTTKNGLPCNKALTVRIDGDRVLVGTHEGFAVYENGNWKTYTTKDGLAHNGIVSVDVSELTGDVWIGTLGGLTRWSAGKFENFTQFNSGMPNDLVYCVYCDGKDIWVATGGGAGHYDTQTKQWEIFTEQNAPMHEPWTYGVSAGDGKVYIAAWGGGVIEYNKTTKKFRDYVDPDGFMEIDLQPDDGVVHDITTGLSYEDGILWVATYFGMSRYDGKNWKGYFDHDSGLISNFINFVRAVGPVVYICTDRGLSYTDGKTWVSYTKEDNSIDGKIIFTNENEKKEVKQAVSFSHQFIIGVDVKDNVIWVATSKGVSRGEKIN